MRESPLLGLAKHRAPQIWPLRFRSILALCLLAWFGPSPTLSAQNLLFVRDDAGSYTASEQARVTLFEGWGYTVTPIADSESQATFDTAVASADVAYVPSTIEAGNLTYKLREAPIGVLLEHVTLDNEFGLVSGDGWWDNDTDVDDVDNSHPVTNGLGTGTQTIVTSAGPLYRPNGTLAPDIQTLATTNSGMLGLGVVETGGTLATSYNGNAIATGHRVRLPWAGDTFDVSTLNSNGLAILQDALVWAATSSSDLRGHWVMDDLSGNVAVDSSSYANDGVLQADAAFIATCESGALSLDGTGDCIEIADNSSLQFGSKATLAGWFKLDEDFDNTSSTVFLADKYLHGNADMHLALAGADYNRSTPTKGSIVFKMENGGYQYTWTSTTSWEAGVWYHVAAVLDQDDPNRARVYINGADDTAAYYGTTSTTGFDFPAPLRLGGLRNEDLTNRGFSGEIRDWRLYSRAISDMEIVALSGLEGHWTFDEGTGTTIADSSGNANHAAFNTGTPVWVTGKRGAALQFDGGSDAATSAPFDPPQRGSVALWIRSDGYPAGRHRPWGVGADYEMWQDIDGLVSCDVSTDGYQGGFITTVSIAEAGRWYHLVAQYDSDTDEYEIYIDGELHKSGVSTWNIVKQVANTLTFGTRTGSNQYFTGAIDDFRVYSRWLCPAEIETLAGDQADKLRITQWVEVATP